MSTREDREHFKTYRVQTRVKHTILSKYLPPYFRILSQANRRLVYIDAFAGRGYYEDDVGTKEPGSPIRALQTLVEKPDLRSVVRCIFSEPDSDNFAALDCTVREFMAKHPEVPCPTVLQATFADLIDELAQRYGSDLDRMAPAFLFVDPCGVSGAAMTAIARVLRRQFSEAFVFFNSAGLTRVLGAQLIATVEELYGSIKVAGELVAAVKGPSSPRKREGLMLAEYEKQLKVLGGATHICSFRIEHKDRETTSHYLIHASKHPLAFRIMKDIMWSEASWGALELRQSSTAHGQQHLLALNDPQVDGDIVRHLQDGPRLVRCFVQSLASEPDNRIAPKYYKQRLIALEESKQIEVWRDGYPAPADSRRSRHGAPTLADDCEVRLCS
jgi:three-Cys-motif partner protein